MSKISCLCALALLSISVIEAAGVQGNWTNLAGGNWATATNWSTNPSVPGIPGGTSDTATFPALGMGTATVTLNVPSTLNQLTMSGGAVMTTNYTISGTGSLVMTTTPTIFLADSVNHINVPVTTDSNMTISLSGQTTSTFQASSSLHATVAGRTLQLTSGLTTMNDPALITSSAAGSGFADNMTILINSPGDSSILSIQNTARFGATSPLIDIDDAGELRNTGSGHIGSAATLMTMGNGSVLFNEAPGALIDAASITVNAMSGMSSGNVQNNGKIHVANNVTISNTPNFLFASNNLETNPVTMAGNGTEFTVGGTFSTDSTWIPNIDSRNKASVSGAGPSVGNLFQILGADTLTLSNGSVVSNYNIPDTLMPTISGSATNIGSFLNIPNIDLVINGMGADFHNTNAMPVTGGTGAQFAAKSLDLRGCGFNLQNAGMLSAPAPISGMGSIGSLTTITNEVSIKEGSQIDPSNMEAVSGTGAVGVKFDIVNGSITTESMATLSTTLITNFGEITGLSTRGAWLELENGNMVLQNGPGTYPFTGLAALNFGSVNGDITTYGVVVHLPQGNFILSNNATANITNAITAVVNVGAGIGSYLVIDNPSALFEMSGASQLTLQNDGVMSDYGVGAQLDAAPQLAMTGGTFKLVNTGSLDKSVIDSTYAVTANLNAGLNVTGGIVSIYNQDPATPLAANSLQNADGCVLNVATNFTMAASTQLIMDNHMTLITNFQPGFTSNASTLNVGTMGNPIDMTFDGTATLTNSYVTILSGGPFAGSLGSTGVTINASQDLIMGTGAQMNLANTIPAVPGGILTASKGILVDVARTLTLNSATLSLANTGTFTNFFVIPTGSYIGSQVTAPTVNITGTSILNVTNTNSDQTTNSLGCQVAVLGALTIQDSGQLNLSNTGGTFTITSRGNELNVTGTFDMSGQYLTNVSTGATVDSTSFGSLIQSTMPIQVNQGTFINDANVKADSIPVLHGATIAGRGIFDPNAGMNAVIDSHGTTYPGDPANPITSPGQPTVGKMTIHGSYVQHNDGTLFINISNSGAGNFSVLHVSGNDGTATIDGTVTVGLIPGFVLHDTDTFNILETTNGLTGTFNPTVVLDSSWTSPLTPLIRYITDVVPPLADPLAALAGPFNIVQLFFIHAPTPPPSTVPLLTSYSVSFEPLFDVINRDNLILEREMQRMRLRYQKEPVSVQPKRRWGQTHAAAAPKTSRQAPAMIQPASHTLASNKQISFSPAPTHFEQERIHEEIIAGDNEHPWNLFFGPVGDVGTINTKKHQIGSDYWVAGALASFNYVFSQAGIGFFTDYNKVNAHVHKHWGSFDFDMLHSCLYATYAPKQLPALAFHSIVGGSFEWYDVHRKTTTGTAKGKTHGSEFDALFVGEYVFSGTPCSSLPENFTIIPRAGLQYIYVDASKYKEHGADTSDLKIHGQHAKSLRSIVDLWMKYTWEWCNAKLTPELNLGWQREFFDKNRPVYFTPTHITAPTSSLTVFGQGKNTFLAGLDLFFEFYERFALEASYDFQWNSLIRDHGFYVGFHTRF